MLIQKCPYCNIIYIGEEIWCRNCHEVIDRNAILCSFCGTPNPGDAHFCKKCATPFPQNDNRRYFPRPGVRKYDDESMIVFGWYEIILLKQEANKVFRYEDVDYISRNNQRIKIHFISDEELFIPYEIFTDSTDLQQAVNFLTQQIKWENVNPVLYCDE